MYNVAVYNSKGNSVTREKQNLIVKDNALINASYRLSLVEERLIILSIIEARESGKGINANDPLSVHAESYIKNFNVHRNGAYKALKEACNDLFERRFSYQEARGKGVANITSRWVSQIAYIDHLATVELIFSPAVIPFITRLEERFTSYELKQISSLSSVHAMRLYELVIQWRSTGKTPVFKIDALRSKLGIENHEYARMGNFKARVLDFAITQINTHTDITAKYEQHKSGRKITGFSFTFTQKNAVKTLSKKPKREQITKKEAEKKAHIGESWPDLLKRLAPDFHIIDL